MDDQIDVNSTGTVTTVFVVDDDDGVRTSLGILLDSAGYRAVPFASADELIDVPGIGEAKLAAVADLVTV